YPLVLETGEINFSFDKENPQDTKVTGTKNNDLMTSYNKEAFKIQKEIIDFQQQNQAKFMEAQQKGDQATMDQISNQMIDLQGKYVEQNKNFIGTNKDSFISLILLTQLASSDALTIDEIKNYYNDLDASVKNSSKGKEF